MQINAREIHKIIHELYSRMIYEFIRLFGCMYIVLRLHLTIRGHSFVLQYFNLQFINFLIHCSGETTFFCIIPFLLK